MKPIRKRLEKAMPFAFDTVQAYRRAVHLTHELIDFS